MPGASASWEQDKALILGYIEIKEKWAPLYSILLLYGAWDVSITPGTCGLGLRA